MADCECNRHSRPTLGSITRAGRTPRSMRDGCDVGALNYIDTRRVETGRTEFLDALRVDERRQSLSCGHVVRSLQGRTQLFGRLNVSTLAAEGFCRLVVPKILLEQIHVQRARIVFGQCPDTPAVIVIDDTDEWTLAENDPRALH